MQCWMEDLSTPHGSVPWMTQAAHRVFVVRCYCSPDTCVIFIPTGAIFVSESEIHTDGHTSVTYNSANSPGGEKFARNITFYNR